MKRAALLLAGALVSLSLQAQNKKIYIPEDLRKMNLQADTSQQITGHSLIHIHNYYDFSNGVVIFYVKGKMDEG